MLTASFTNPVAVAKPLILEGATCSNIETISRATLRPSASSHWSTATADALTHSSTERKLQDTAAEQWHRIQHSQQYLTAGQAHERRSKLLDAGLHNPCRTVDTNFPQQLLQLHRRRRNSTSAFRFLPSSMFPVSKEGLRGQHCNTFEHMRGPQPHLQLSKLGSAADARSTNIGGLQVPRRRLWLLAGGIAVT